MKSALLGLFIVCMTVLMSCVPTTHPVYMGKEMSSGYDIGVTTNNNVLGWLHDSNGYMKMEYPQSQLWGAVYMTVGKVKDLPNKPVVDLSAFKLLTFELKSNGDSLTILVGMKDKEDPDDGTETKIPVIVTGEWKKYELPLTDFKTLDLKSVYMLTEFVFNGDTAQTAYFRNIEFVK